MSLTICKIINCEKSHVAFGYCRFHYYRFKKYGDPLTMLLRKKTFCKYYNCSKQAHRFGFCHGHYVTNMRLEIMKIIDQLVCSKCGFSDFRALQLDHKNGGGLKIAKSKGRLGMYKFYFENPEIAKKELQTLCANCNWIKKSMNKEVRSI